MQIKRNPPHPPYTSNNDNEASDVLELLSEPAACPYCAHPDLGVYFEAPPFEWGLACPDPATSTETLKYTPQHPHTGGTITAGPFMNQRSALRLDEKLPQPHALDVSKGVTVDLIRPDWEEKLASARRRLARKAHAARMLHQSALLPNGSNDSNAFTPSPNSSSSRNRPGIHSRSHHESLAYSQLGPSEYGRSLSASQVRALEQKMIDEAIRASLAQ